MDHDGRESRQVRVEQCGQDENRVVRICLVQSSMNNEVPNQNAFLALVSMHLDVLMSTGSSYFRGLAESFRPTPNLHEVTLEVDREDVQLYINCFTMMREPHDSRWLSDFTSPEDLEGIRSSLRLLGIACHIDYVHLKRLLLACLLSKPSRWSTEEILLVLKQTPMRKEGLSFFVLGICYYLNEDLIIQLLKTARVQGWRPIEQEVVAIVHDELNLLLLEAHNECDGKNSMEGMKGMEDRLMNICKIMNALMAAQVASQGVKCLLQYPSIPKFLSYIVRNDIIRYDVAVAFQKIILSIYKEVVDRTVFLGQGDRHALLKDWTNFLEGYESRAADLQFKRAKEAIFGSLPGKQQLELLDMTVQYGYYSTFGEAKKLSKVLRNSMVASTSED